MPSTAILGAEYDAAARQLEIVFVTGRRYVYHDVPDEVAQGLRSARSTGGYFNTHIRDRYRFTRRRAVVDA